MKFHPYGQRTLVKLPHGTSVQDLRSLSHFNKIIRNYLMMCRIEKNNNDKQ